MSSRLIVRLVSNFKYFPFPSASESPSASNEKISRAFIISPHQYGSFRPRHIPSPLLNRSDSLFSHSDFQVPTKSSSSTTTTTTTNQISLLEHYLQSYNPLKIDLTNIHDGTVKTSIVQPMPALSDTDTQPIRNCYALICTNKQQKIIHGGRRYVRLEEQENCSTTRSILLDDHLSECSTKLSNITLPTLMITDCSDQQRLHTQIIELNEEKKDDE